MTDIEKVPSQPVDPTAEAAPEPAPEPAAAPAPAISKPEAPPQTLRELLAFVDAGYAVFRAAAIRFPGERMSEHIEPDGWTRKQMLAHIATWHDLAHERLGKFILSGKPAKVEVDTDTINARAARTAIGKSSGEVVKDIEATFNRLRRQLERLTDDQLRRHGGWAAGVIAGDTYEHYAEHIDELYVPEPEPGGGRR